MSAPVGADIESLCSKCGDVWHVVVAKVGDRIAKVQCKQCSGFHRHKPPPGKEGLAGSSAKKKTAGASTATGAAKKPAASRARKHEPDPPAVAADMSRPVRRYSAAEMFTPGDRITHPSFGQGIVEGSLGAGKIQVVFPDGSRRVLAIAKAESTLGKPTNSPHG